MIKTVLVVAALVVTAAPASTQIVSPLNPANGADVTAAANAAAAAQASANAAQASIPGVCTVPPANGTLTGAVGTATPCTSRPDGNAQTPVQGGNTTLAANCAWSITFARAFVSSVPLVWASVVDSTGAQMPCKVQTRSSTTATGVCAPAQSTVLNLSIVTSGLSLNPFSAICTAGIPVMVGGREPTQ